MRSNKNTSKIILAATVAILATTISYSAFNNMRGKMEEQQKLISVMQKSQESREYKDTYAYAVATSDLKAGEIVSDENVDFKQFDFVNKEAFENRSDVVNKVLLRDIMAGETFTTSYIAQVSGDNVALKEGYRALTLPADNFQGKSDVMKPGIFVDIYSASSESNWTLEDIRIVSFEKEEKSISDLKGVTKQKEITINDASAITFEVPAGDVSSFISNISKSKLVLVTRNPSDKKVIHKKTKIIDDYSAKAASSISKLPKLPKFQTDNISGLPDPIKPIAVPQSPSVEVIEANVKTKVTFD